MSDIYDWRVKMQNLIFTYALIKSLSDEGEDYIDAFWPFTIRVIPNNSPVNIDFVQKQLLNEYNLNIPQHVLRSILNRAKIKGYLSYSNRKYRLTETGDIFKQNLETENEVNRKINSLIEDIRLFFAENGLELSPDDIKEVLNGFIQKNLDPLIEFIDPSSAYKKVHVQKANSDESLLMKYFNDAEEKRPNEYLILNNMVLGSLICAIVYSPEPQEFVKIKQQKFRDCRIYLDANYVFSLFELHSPEYNKPALELFRILQQFNFEIRIFSFTINEMCRVLNRYGEEAHIYPTTIRVDTIYSSLKRKGWTKSTARKFISEIEDHLTAKNIKIEWIPEIDLDRYQPKTPNIVSFFLKYKPLQSPVAQNHDIAAIELINKHRGKDVRKLERSIAIFLTSDRGLSQLDLVELHHKEKGTIPEVIQDRLLTNILWLSNPKIKISLNSIVAAHSRELFVKRRVWDRFYKVLRQLRKDEKITDNDISILLLDNQIENDLKNIDESEIDEITPKFALDEIERAAKKSKDEHKKEIANIESDFIVKLDQMVNDIERKRDDEWLEKIQMMKSNARRLASEKAKKLILGIKLSIILISIVLIVIFYQFISPIFSLIPVAMIIIVILGIPIPKYWNLLEGYLSKRYYTEIEKKMQLNE